MKISPLLTVCGSIFMLLVIYFCTDIKPSTPARNDAVTASKVETAESFIFQYQRSLNKREADFLDSLSKFAKSSSDTITVSKLIKEYENLHQYNIAAFYHSLKATKNNTSSDWELAGDRQISVSHNEAYDSLFNNILYKEGIQSYKKALELDSNNIDAKIKLATAIVDKGEQPMEGIQLLLKIVEKDPNNIAANITLGKFGLMSRQYNKAIQRLEKVLPLQANNTEVLFLLAESYNKLGDKEKALEYLKKCDSLIENKELKEKLKIHIKELSELN